MAIFDEILQLSNKYSNQLDLQINTRMNEMKFDDTSHYLIYRVLGITNQEGNLIDIYQNKGRFLYKYAGLLLRSQLFYVLDIKIQMQRKQELIIHLVQDLKHLKLIA